MTKTYTITEGVIWDDEDIDDHVLGSGALSYSWWGGIEQVGDSFFLTADPQVDEDADMTIRFTRQDFADECRKCLSGEWTAWQTGTGVTIADTIRKDDLDADAVDCILQMIVFGELVYG